MDTKALAERLAKADEKMLTEMLREAELHLSSQQTVALAADQRAINLAGFLSAATVVLIGAAGSLLIKNQPALTLGLICILVAGAFLVSLFYAVRSAAPIGFDFVGSSPDDWIEDIETDRPYTACLADICAHHAESITDNRDRMDQNAKKLRISIWVATGALAIGGIAFVLTLAIAY